MLEARAVVAAYSKRAVALGLDLSTSFVGFGYGVGYLTGAITDDGIKLSNAGAAVTFLLMAAYFFVSAQKGGTPWQRFLGTRGETGRNQQKTG